MTSPRALEDACREHLHIRSGKLAPPSDRDVSDLIAFAQSIASTARAEERERCAKLADTKAVSYRETADHVEGNIPRARWRMRADAAVDLASAIRAAPEQGG